MDGGPCTIRRAHTGRVDLTPGCRPRLLPAAVLLRRSAAELQIGLDPGWRVPDAAGHWQSVLNRLDGRRTWGRIRTDERSVDIHALGRLLTALVGAGLADLGSDAVTPASSRTRVHVLGGTTLSAQVTSRLHRVGIEGQQVTSDAPPDPAADLIILATDAGEVERTAAAGLVRQDAAHLLVRSGPTGAVVGPLVVPGRTACLHCTDLSRRDADPAWPRLLEQLQHRWIGGCPAVVVDWAVAMTVTQVLGFLAGSRPETYGATVEIAPPAYATTWRSWSPHRECGCRWLAVA